MFPLDPSDFVLLIDFVLAVVLLGVFALGRPRTWYTDPLGWVIFYYALSVVALLFLIGWAIVLGQRMDEIFRFLIAIGLGAGLIWKTTAVVGERQRGRLAGERLTLNERNGTMSIPQESEPLVIGETVSTSSPKVNLGIAKTVVSAVGGALVGGLSALSTALTDEVVSQQEWTFVALATIIGSGLVAGATWTTPTTVTRKQ